MTMEAIIQTKLIYISRSVYLAFFEKSEIMYSIFIENLKYFLASHNTMIGNINGQTASEHYATFCKYFEDDLKYISQKDIASYLNIKPETLSRIRSNKANPEKG
jgi:CRP/FNR family transcriptional regulator, anaerobic regulatory protein